MAGGRLQMRSMAGVEPMLVPNQQRFGVSVMVRMAQGEAAGGGVGGEEVRGGCTLTELPDHLMAAVWPSEMWLVGCLVNTDLKRILRLSPVVVHLAYSSELSGMGLSESRGTMVLVGLLEGMDGLEDIDIEDHTLEKQGAEALGRALGRMRTLKRLHLALCTGDEGVRALGPHLPSSLQDLDLEGNQIGAVGAGALGRHLTFSLLRLHLGWNDLGAAGAQSLGRHLPSSLLDLNLDRNDLGDADAEVIARHLPSCLQRLHLGLNRIGAAGAKALAQHLLSSPFHLNLYWNELGDAEAEAFARHLLPSLRCLDLTGNALGALGAKALAEHLPCSLRFLHLGGNHLGAAGREVFARRVSSSLVVIGLRSELLLV